MATKRTERNWDKLDNLMEVCGVLYDPACAEDFIYAIMKYLDMDTMNDLIDFLADEYEYFEDEEEG